MSGLSITLIIIGSIGLVTGLFIYKFCLETAEFIRLLQEEAHCEIEYDSEGLNVWDLNKEQTDKLMKDFERFVERKRK